MCYLAAEGGRHPRRELAELLWPQSEKRHARADLRAVLYKLRKTLREDSAHDGVARFFVIEGDLLGLEPRGIGLDLEALEAAVSLARRETLPAGGGSSAITVGRRELMGRLQGSLALYRGDFMEGFSLEDAPEYELWLEAGRARWRSLFGELCEGLSRLEGEEGLTAEAIGTARLWVRHAPLEEAACRRLMELLSGAGESERALLAYEGFENTLKRELGTAPSAQMQGLAHRLHEEVEERASLGCEPCTLSGHSCAFGLRGAAGRPRRRVRGARLRVPRCPRRTNARGVHPGGGRDRQDAPGRGVLDLGRIPRGGRPGGRQPRRKQDFLTGRW